MWFLLFCSELVIKITLTLLVDVYLFDCWFILLLLWLVTNLFCLWTLVWSCGFYWICVLLGWLLAGLGLRFMWFAWFTWLVDRCFWNWVCYLCCFEFMFEVGCLLYVFIWCFWLIEFVCGVWFALLNYWFWYGWFSAVFDGFVALDFVFI